jgi:toxin ParE1/3/4
MADYKLSDEADAELDHIYEFSILNFGLEKAQEYLSGFHDSFSALA